MRGAAHAWLGCALLAALGSACPLEPGTCRDDADCPVLEASTGCASAAGQCVEGRCEHPLRSTGPCDDGDGCTFDDQCSAQGECLGQAIACALPPAPQCETAELLRVARAPGACVDDSCRFLDELVPCAYGCRAGACQDDPCLGVTCEQPPPDRCRDPWTLELHDPVGVCLDGACDYPPVLVRCALGCASGLCRDGRGPALDALEVSPTVVHFSTPQATLRWRARGAVSARIEVVEDSRVLCDTRRGCAVEGSPDDGAWSLEVPFVDTTLRLVLDGVAGQSRGEVQVRIQEPHYPELRFNDLGMWRLTHRPLRPPYTFVVIGDIQYSQGECPRPEHATRLELKQQIVDLEPRPAFVLAVGDMLINGKPCEFDQFIDDTLRPFYEEHGIPWLMVAGNHDLYDPAGPATYLEVIGEHTLSFDLGGLRIVGSNNYVEELTPHYGFSDPLASWLEAELVEAEQLGKAGVFYAVHYPPRQPTDVGACGSNLLHPFDHHFFDGRRGYAGADRYLELFGAYAPLAAMALYGHTHVYANYVRDGVRHLVSGGGSGSCIGGPYDEGEQPDSSPPLHDGAFDFFVRLTVLDDSALRYRGEVLKRGSGNQPTRHYDFDQATDEVLQTTLPLPFVERFDDPTERIDVWDFFTPYHDALAPVGYSRWRRDAGALLHNGELRHGERASCWPACHGSLARTWTRTWGDLRARVSVQGSDQPIVGLVVRYQDDDHYYRLALDRVAGQVVLTRHAGEIVELSRVAAPATGASVLLGLEAREQGDGTLLRGQVDGVACGEVTDSAQGRPRTGGVGLTTYGAGAVWFDDVEVVEATP